MWRELGGNRYEINSGELIGIAVYAMLLRSIHAIAIVKGNRSEDVNGDDEWRHVSSYFSRPIFIALTAAVKSPTAEHSIPDGSRYGRGYPQRRPRIGRIKINRAIPLFSIEHPVTAKRSNQICKITNVLHIYIFYMYKIT